MQHFGGSLDDYLKVLYKRKWVAASCFLTFLSSMVIITYRQVPVYVSVAKIIIGLEVPQRLPLEELLAQPIEKVYYQTELEILRSEPTAQGVVRALKLTERDPRITEEGWSRFVRNSTTFERLGDSKIFLISVETPSPELARDIANAYGEVYIQQTIERSAEASRKSLQWLTEQVADLKGKLEESEMALVKYLEENGSVPSDGGADAGDKDSLRGEPGVLGNLDSQLVSSELELRRLSQKYKDSHPKMIKLRADIDNIRAQIAQEKRHLSDKQKKLIQYGILKREAELNKSLYNLLMKEMKEIKLLGDVGSLPVSFLERAKAPTAPIRPRPIRNILMGIVLGIVLAIGAAFSQEFLDRSIKNEEDVERYLKLPLLGVIPRTKGTGAHFSILEDPFSHESEAWRLLRTNIKFSAPQGELRVLLVTSTGPMEGKTTLAKNLAVALAQGEDRVILVDADLRKPMVHKAFGVPQEPGVTNLLVEGGKKIEDVVQASGIKNLSLLTSGAMSPNPAELLESRRMKELMEALRRDYHQVILDSPPIRLVSDAHVLSSVADSVLIVVEAGRLSRDMIIGARLQLEKARAKICGVALNKAKMERGRYYYSYYYGGHTAEQGRGKTSS